MTTAHTNGKGIRLKAMPYVHAKWIWRRLGSVLSTLVIREESTFQLYLFLCICPGFIYLIIYLFFLK